MLDPRLGGVLVLRWGYIDVRFSKKHSYTKMNSDEKNWGYQNKFIAHIDNDHRFLFSFAEIFPTIKLMRLLVFLHQIG